MDTGHAQIMITIEPQEDVDDTELDGLTGQLRRLLLDLDTDAVERVLRQEVPPGAKSADPTIIGALAVTLSPVLMKSVVTVVRTWIQHRPVRSIKVVAGKATMEVTAVSRADEAKLVEAFIKTLGGK